MSYEYTTYLCSKTVPDLIIWIKHLKYTCDVNVLLFAVMFYWLLSPSTCIRWSFWTPCFSQATFEIFLNIQGRLASLLLCVIVGASFLTDVFKLAPHHQGSNRKFQHPKSISFWQLSCVLKSTCAKYAITQTASICTSPPLCTFFPRPQWNGDKSAVTLKKVLTCGRAPVD